MQADRRRLWFGRFREELPPRSIGASVRQSSDHPVGEREVVLGVTRLRVRALLVRTDQNLRLV